MMARTLHRLAAGERDPRLPDQLARLAALVVNRGACHHPDGTVRLVRSALRVFATEIDLHLAGRCSTMEGRR
jgi:NADH:ubiquinone oxidoreductase subunit F (NADH-binding)